MTGCLCPPTRPLTGITRADCPVHGHPAHMRCTVVPVFPGASGGPDPIRTLAEIRHDRRPLDMPPTTPLHRRQAVLAVLDTLHRRTRARLTTADAEAIVAAVLREYDTAALETAADLTLEEARRQGHRLPLLEHVLGGRPIDRASALAAVLRARALVAYWRQVKSPAVQQSANDLEAALDGDDQAAPAERSPHIDVVFDGPPGPDAGRFVEVEVDGRSVDVGEWLERPAEGWWTLRITAADVAAASARHKAGG